MKRERKSIDGMLRLVLTLLVVLLSTPFAYAQAGHGDHATDDTHHGEEKAHHSRTHVAVFAGNTQLEGHSAFTFGADFEYRLPFLNDRIGVGALAEAVLGDHTATIVGGVFYVHPVGNFKVLFAPSAEFTEGHREFLFRSGVGYDFYVGQVSVTPAASLDFIGGHVAQVYGVALGISL